MTTSSMSPHPKGQTEQQRADQLANYLESVDSGSAFEVPAEFDDPELAELAQTARTLKTTLQDTPAVPAWVAPSMTKAARPRRLQMFAWFALPAAGFAVLFIFITAQGPATLSDDSVALTSATAILDDPVVTAVVADLQNDETFAEIDQAIADLEAVTEEMEALLDEEAIVEIDTALASAEL